MKNQQSGNERRKNHFLKTWGPRLEEIKWLSDDQDWTQTEIAERYGVAQTTISKVMKRFNIETRSRANYGDKNGRYKDGSQSRLYRLMIEKDRCAECGDENRLAIHHINYDHFDNRIENLQILCWPCHNRKTKQKYWDDIKENGSEFPIKRDENGKFTA